MVERKDSQVLIPQGTLKVYSHVEGTSTTTMNRLAKASRAREQNTGEYLAKNLLDTDSSLYSSRILGSGLVLAMEPINIYGYGDIMVVAATESVLNAISNSQGDQVVDTFNIFDCDDTLQTEYYRYLLATLRAQNKTPFPNQMSDKKPDAMIFENTAVSVSTDKHRMTRSIALPHAHIVKVGDWIDQRENGRSTFVSRAENKLLKDEMLFNMFRDFFESSIGQERVAYTDIKHRSSPPYGYTISLPINWNEEFYQQAKTLKDFMAMHHQVYSKFSDIILEQMNQNRSRNSQRAKKPIESQVIPQPSYRTYIYYLDENLMLTISPEAISTTGVIEGAEVFIKRGPNYLPNCDEQELAKFIEGVVNTATGELER